MPSSSPKIKNQKESAIHQADTSGSIAMKKSFMVTSLAHSIALAQGNNL